MMILNGSYRAQDYDHFYELTMPEGGNVFLEVTHNSGYSAIYDSNLNWVADIGQGPIHLEAGTYIVHADYSSPTYGALTFYSPQPSHQGTATPLEPGTFHAETYDHFYELTMPEGGNVFLEVTHNSGYSAIYDSNLNWVADIGQGPIHLEAGTYIVHADYSSPTYGALTFTGVEPTNGGLGSTIDGTSGDDLLTGTVADDSIRGLSGNDSLEGFDGTDTLVGGEGRDTIDAGEGDDSLSGGLGHDRLLGRGGDDRGNGGGGRDRIFGGSGNDTLEGKIGSDQLFGQRGRDFLKGGSGQDRIMGGGGHDTLAGGFGGDVLAGGRGRDMLTGGAGRDTFAFSRGNGQDTITDFELGIDRIKIGRGASQMEQLSFEQHGNDVLVSFSDVNLTVENASVESLSISDHFLFG